MYSIIQTTTSSKKQAKLIAKILLDSNLSACVQISKIKSHYIWQGKIQTSKEFLLSIKTHSKCALQIQNLIKKHHSYDTPEIIEIKVDSMDKKYQKWLDGVINAPMGNHLRD